MSSDSGIEKINLDTVDWRGSREFFESLGKTLEKLDDKSEAYDFTWVGKRKAVIEAGAPINKTLRPNLDASKNWDTTKNLFIEGDNLDALKLLQESYLGQVKMIYIDPPYNTGKDFVYRDDFKADSDQYDEDTEYRDTDGNINYKKKNEKTNGRYHSDWLSMMYPRLKLARNLLTSDGVIFISIGEDEQANLKKLCDEVFNENNFISQISLITGANQSGEGVKIQKNLEYILVYARNYDESVINKVDEVSESLRSIADAPTPLITRKDMGYTVYYNPDTKNLITEFDYDKDKIELNDESLVYQDNQSLIAEGYVPIRPGVKNGQLHRWRWGVDTFNERIDEVVVKETNGKYGIFFTQSGMNSPKNYLNYPVGTKQVKDLFDGAAYFDYPKNVRLISYLTQLGSDKDSLILDFFSGSATTAHAVMQLNAEDGGTRSWIMVQLPEATDEKSDAFKAGYKTIPEISRERIRRAGDKIAAEHPGAGVDYGFRSLRTDETNYKDVYASSSDQLQATLIDVVDNIKDDRSDLDLLYGVLTQSATPLNRSYEVRELGESKVILYDYTDRASGLVACFDATVSQETVKEISKLKPLTVVFKDASFQSSQEKVNLAEHFRITSPDTKVKVI